jgi:hypothetical protein
MRSVHPSDKFFISSSTVRSTVQQGGMLSGAVSQLLLTATSSLADTVQISRCIVADLCFSSDPVGRDGSRFSATCFYPHGQWSWTHSNVWTIGCEEVEWIYLACIRDRWQAVGNTVLNHRVLYNTGNSWLAEELVACEEELCSVAFVSQVTDRLSCAIM